jgi:protein tyrosine/serine phosphatase
MTGDRVLDLEGVHNFRDFGGYAVTGGGCLKRGVLWRSGQHHGASEADLARIAALGLADVFDLRSSHERTTHPCRRPEGFAAAIHLSDDPVHVAAPHLSVVSGERKVRDAASTREGMRQNYRRIAYRPELIAMMRRQLSALAEGRGASLVNCMAGKDRTGIAVAMIQLALGVHRDDAVADYLLTNSAGDPEARIAAGAATIRAIERAVDPEVVRVIMGVEPEWIEAAFAAVAEEHGSVEGYLREVLGVDDVLRERLREALVEG